MVVVVVPSGPSVVVVVDSGTVVVVVVGATVVVVVVGGIVTVVVVVDVGATVVVVVVVGGTVVVVVVVVGASVVVVVDVGGSTIVVVVVVSGTVVVVVVVSGIVVVDVVVGGMVVVDVLVEVEVDVLVEVEVDVLVVVTGPPLHGRCGGTEVVVDAGKRQPGCDVVVGPPAPTAVAEMPSACGFACGIGHVTAASIPMDSDAVVVIPTRYVVIVASAEGAVSVTVTSGVCKTPGWAVGVCSVTSPVSFGVTVPNAVALASAIFAALMRNVVAVGVAVTAALDLLYPAGVIPAMATKLPTLSRCGADVVYS
jgi:hypothetical protein